MKKFILLSLFLTLPFILRPLLAPANAFQPGENPRCTQNCNSVGTECLVWECSLCDVCEEWKQSLPWFESTSRQYDQNLNNDAETNTVSKDSYLYDTVNGIILASKRMLGGSTVPSTENSGISNGGAIGAMGKMIGMMYQHPPASSVEYVAFMGEKAGFIPKAYAQGIGFRGFVPLIKVWSAMRNAAYLFFAFLLVVIGIMIIFKVKVDPRTIVTVQVALPRIVIAILLVTFSYAIVGLLIDAMNVVIGLLVWLFATADLIKNPQATIAVIQEQNALVIMKGMFGLGAGKALAGLVGEVIGGWVQTVSIIGVPIIEFILILSMVVAIFKLLFTLIMAYVSVIISVLMAPIQIALNAVPNFNTFKSWFMNLLANLSVFPTIAAMLILASALTGKGDSLGVEEFPGMENAGWRPPLLGGASGRLSQDAILFLIGYGILLMTPGMVDRIKKLFQIPPTEMPSIGAAIGAGATASVKAKDVATTAVPRIVTAAGKVLKSRLPMPGSGNPPAPPGPPPAPPGPPVPP